MIESDLDQGRQRRVSRDMAADPVIVLVGLGHHRRRVVANQVLDLTLDAAVSRIRDLFRGGDRVHVRRITLQRRSRAKLSTPVHQALKQEGSAAFAGLLDHFIERLQPLTGFLGVLVSGFRQAGLESSILFCIKHGRRLY